MDKSTIFGDAVVLMHRARDYILLSAFFSTVNSTFRYEVPVPEHLQQVLDSYGSGLGREIADAFACMSLVTFASLFLSERDASPLLVEDFTGQLRQRVEYFREKRNRYIAHRREFEAEEIAFDQLSTPTGEFGRGRAIKSSLPASCFAGDDREKFLQVIEATIEILNRKWDEAFDQKAQTEV